jgi:uncharacterized protein
MIMADSRSELSMDEILSSIKKIIADEDRVKPGSPRKQAATSRTPAAPQIPAEEEILELTQTAEMGDDPDNLLDSRNDGANDLLDDGKAQSLARSFSTLQTLAEPGVAPQIVRSGETSLEGLARELMRPMLKEWLDSNLPGIVESMVEREIARITKKG